MVLVAIDQQIAHDEHAAVGAQNHGRTSTCRPPDAVMRWRSPPTPETTAVSSMLRATELVARECG